MNFGSVYTLHDSDDEEEAVREDAPSSAHLSAMSPAIGSIMGAGATGGSVPRPYPPAPFEVPQGNPSVIRQQQRQAARSVHFASDTSHNEDNKDMQGCGLENDPFSAIRAAFSHEANVVTSAGRAHPLPPAAPRGYPPPDTASMLRREGLPQDEQMQSQQWQQQLAQQQQQQKSRSTHNELGRHFYKGNSQAPPFQPETRRWGGIGAPSAAHSTAFPARPLPTLANPLPECYGSNGEQQGGCCSASVLQSERTSVPSFLPAQSLPPTGPERLTIPTDLGIRRVNRAPRPTRTWTRKVCVYSV